MSKSVTVLHAPSGITMPIGNTKYQSYDLIRAVSNQEYEAMINVFTNKRFIQRPTTCDSIHAKWISFIYAHILKPVYGESLHNISTYHDVSIFIEKHIYEFELVYD